MPRRIRYSRVLTLASLPVLTGSCYPLESRHETEGAASLSPEKLNKSNISEILIIRISPNIQYSQKFFNKYSNLEYLFKAYFYTLYTCIHT